MCEVCPPGTFLAEHEDRLYCGRCRSAYTKLVDKSKQQKQPKKKQPKAEKPKVEEAPSTLVAVGKYILTPEIFDKIKNNKVLDREKNFTQALTELAKDNNLVSVELDGERYDTGSKLGYVMANVSYALKDETIKDSLIKELKKLKATRLEALC